MTALRPGDIVTIDFPGAQGIKRRPAVIVSSTTYHLHRPDVIVGIVTSQVERAATPTDHILRDWEEANLRLPSAFRTFIGHIAGYCRAQDRSVF